MAKIIPKSESVATIRITEKTSSDFGKWFVIFSRLRIDFVVCGLAFSREGRQLPRWRVGRLLSLHRHHCLRCKDSKLDCRSAVTSSQELPIRAIIHEPRRRTNTTNLIMVQAA
jgi:hypothetical protein